ncbi:hypothetical protein PVAND_008590 [Polypedilum vanderplanki]|uniref:MD-2-related lipid-recognition domain-containing protein n=1 Tax=Polypedilum vanderplanki TaxID=319348 RepID=A0A9J6CAF7_POLVA|nr:hypothetical protein PVAND_008590 [Polypedilum vanderplanki]
MLKRKVFFVLFPFILKFVENGLLPESSYGRYFDAIIDRFEVVYENKSIWEWNIKVRKINKTRSLVGYVLVKEPLGNDFKDKTVLLKKQGGEYRYQPYGIPPTPLCLLLVDDKYTYPDIAKNSDFPADVVHNCPFKPANYSFNGVTFSLKNVPKIIVPSGDYAVELTFYDSITKFAGIYRIYGTIIQV